MSVFEIHGGPITHRYLMNKSKFDLASMYMELLAVRNRENAQRDRLIAALTPSADTKAVYKGEVRDDVWSSGYDENGEYEERRVSHHVSWAAIKEVMALIRKEGGIDVEWK